MKIVVLNGSPKGDISVTMQYINYIQKKFPIHEIKIQNISLDIKRIENDITKFQAIIDEVQSSDGIIWATPVYYFLVPSQLKRFIELIYERHQEHMFHGKYGAALITSIHCYDHIAMNYLTGISEDLGLRFVGGLSPDMEDLSDPRKRKNILDFVDYFFQSITTGSPTFRTFASLPESQQNYQPGDVPSVPKNNQKKVVLLVDGNNINTNLGRMIDVFQKSAPFPVEIIDLNSVDIKGGCLGCIHCGYDNTCLYQDGVKSFIQEKIIPADAVIIAGDIKDRYLSSRWKMFFDRSFVFGHTPILNNKQIGIIMSGPLRQISNLRELFEGYIQMQDSNLVGFVTDEDRSEDITGSLKTLANKMDWSLDRKIIATENYLGTGVYLLFKEFVPRARGIFHADHVYYKKHGLYKRGRKSRNLIFNLVLSIGNHFSGFREGFHKQMKQGMIAELKKIVENS